MRIKLIEPGGRLTHYIGANVANEAANIGANIGINAAKSAVYKTRLNQGRPYPVFVSADDFDNYLILKTDAGDSIEFLDAKINVTKKKTIKSQSLVNMRGSVKEYIQEDDYLVKVKGDVIIDDPYSFPTDDLQLLNNILSVNETLLVSSPYLNDVFDIYRLAFTSGNFHQTSITHLNVMPIELDFLSDIDHSFLVEDNL